MKNRFLPLLVSLLAAIVLVFVVEDFVRRVIVIPLLYVSWFVALVLESLPQWIFWVAFVVTALAIARKSMAKDKVIRRQPWTPRTGYQGPVATWFMSLKRARNQEFSRWRLAQDLKKLTQDILFLDARFDHHKRERQWEHFKASLPPEVKAYFEAPLPEPRSLSHLWRLCRARRHATALDLDPETVVKYFEDKLAPLGE